MAARFWLVFLDKNAETDESAIATASLRFARLVTAMS